MMLRVGLLLDDGDRRILREAGLTPTQYNLLRFLDDAPSADGGVSIIRLSERLLCTRGNVTRLVRRLSAAGIVRTRPDPHDRRVVKVDLTAKGARRLALARKLHLGANHERFADLPGRDLEHLRELVDTLIDVLDKHLAQSPRGRSAH